MARNRKRAKERRARRPQPVTARVQRDEDGTPDPLNHAAPDAELAEAQLALGRPELADDSEEQEEELLEAEERESEADELESDSGRLTRTRSGFDGDADDSDGAQVAAPAATAVAAPRARPLSRLVNFVQGSWRELQRVQWPDRRQVVQATGVVIGFVIVAGVFLGVADTLSGHLVNYVLNGHW